MNDSELAFPAAGGAFEREKNNPLGHDGGLKLNVDEGNALEIFIVGQGKSGWLDWFCLAG